MATNFIKHRNNRIIIKMFVFLIISLDIYTVQAGSPKETSKNPVYGEYIENYYRTAVEQQKRHRIPASITLAQALLESAAGQSYLAIAGNNHFGLKSKDDWKGVSIYKNDDGQYTSFRKYLYVEDSYEDRSLILTGREIYRPLFKLKVTDYKGWAKGLGRCGYATDPDYTSKLIRLIEAYQLYHYDTLEDALEISKADTPKKAGAPKTDNVTKPTNASTPLQKAKKPGTSSLTKK
jgi:flagellum-specific peptidoglycan hydrolase FlgJ